MQTQSKELNFEGQNIYAGFDVHLKSWKVTIMSDQMTLKTFVMPPKPEVLSDYLHTNYPRGFMWPARPNMKPFPGNYRENYIPGTTLLYGLIGVLRVGKKRFSKVFAHGFSDKILPVAFTHKAFCFGRRWAIFRDGFFLPVFVLFRQANPSLLALQVPKSHPCFHCLAAINA